MKIYQSLIAEIKQIAVLRSIGAVLGWDERTYMPHGAAESRAEQSSLIATLAHARLTSRQIGDWLGAVEGSDLVKDPLSDSAVNIREIRRSYDRACKLPAALVEELARTEVLSEHAWADARRQSDYARFQPWLEKMLAYKRREAACVGDPKKPYDALLDEFEPGETAENLRRVFQSLRGPLVELVGRIASSGKKAPAEILERVYPVEAQKKLAQETAGIVGFDFEGGRLDVSVHPFSTGIAPGDARITTRYDEHYFGDAFFGTLHECGHAMYSQGLPREHFGTPRGRDLSLGIHESQSRMWENFVGRGRPFWKFFFSKVQAAFPEALAGVSAEQWYFVVNDVRPSLIRTESDEVTYNLHVLLRFELEQALLCEEISAGDLPGEWNRKMKEYLGVTPPDDARGCLQDIHWAGGAIGYFPTYTLGNLYAAQFFEKVKQEIGDLDAQFSRGNFSELLGWLRKNIHSQGMKYRAPELVKKITGRPLSAEPLLNHLKGKAGELCGV